MARKRKFTNESFETGKPNGNFMMIYFDMLDSKAWDDLTPYAKDLYLRMRRKYTRKVSSGYIVESNKDNISMPNKEYMEFMHQRMFYKSIDQLIENGFVRMIRNGRFTKQCNIYGFVDKWQEYGKESYEIPISWKRAPAIEKQKSIKRL